MKSSKINLNSGGKGSQTRGLGLISQFFSVPLSSTHIRALCGSASLGDLDAFFLALQSCYRLDLSTARALDTIVRVIKLYFVIRLTHSSQFISYLVFNRVYLNVPSFVMPLFVHLITKVNSRHNSFGWLQGTMYYKESVADLQLMRSLSNDYLVSLLSRVGLSRYAGIRSVEYIQLSLREFADIAGESEHALFSAMLEELESSKTAFYSQTLAIYSGYIETDVSTLYGVYRFNNSDNDNEYNVVYESCSSLSEGLINLFSCYLFLFQPVFTDSSGTPFPSIRRNSDVPFVLNGTRVDYWKYYLSGVHSLVTPLAGVESTTITTDTKNPKNTAKFKAATTQAVEVPAGINPYRKYLLLVDSNYIGIVRSVSIFPEPNVSLHSFGDYTYYLCAT